MPDQNSIYFVVLKIIGCIAYMLLEHFLGKTKYGSLIGLGENVMKKKEDKNES